MTTLQDKLATPYHEIDTELCHMMKAHGSDKGLGWHNYTTLYTLLFEELRHQPISFFEVGLGTNNTSIPSNMGPNGVPGASLRGWQQYFDHPDTKIYGADVDTGILFHDRNIATFYVNQLQGDTIKHMWSQIPGEMDVILDDGLHTFEANWSFLQNSIHKLKKGGIYVVEDLVQDTANRFRAKIEELRTTYNPSFIDVVVIPHSYNQADNVVFVMKL